MGASLNACSYFPRWSTVRRAYYRHRKKQRECTASPSPFASFSQEMMKNEGAKVEDRWQIFIAVESCFFGFSSFEALFYRST